MLNFLTKHKFALLTAAVSFLILFFFYYQVFLAPNDYLFSADGDGIKNYYTYLYHAKYDAGFNHFSGMNYPYYEHIVYTDAHPALSYLIGKLGLVDYGIGILNMLMLLSYPIAALFLFKILRHYDVNNWWAFAGSLAITFLSPQVYRMTGHFSLSYVFAVPLMWWLLIKCVNGRAWLWSGIIGLYLLCFFFIHPYLGMILVFFSLVFWLVNLVVDRKKWMRSLTHIFIQCLAPVFIFQGYVGMTDTHADRLSNPSGFFDYYASWKSLLIAHDGPLSNLYSALRINIGNWESWSYLGFSTIVFAGVIGYYLFQKRRSIDFKSLLKQELFLFLIAAYLILIFAFCFPLKYGFLRWIADLLGPLKQFRVLGRFTWIFFYVFTVATIVGMHRLYLKQAKSIYRTIFFVGILFCVFEFAPVHWRSALHITKVSNQFKTENLDEEMIAVIDYIDTHDYDAILFLPFQHMSSENVILLGAERANYQSFLISYHTHLPLLNSISSRMSLTEAVRFNTYFSPGFMEKELTYDLPKNDRILIVKNRDPLKLTELRMIWESEKLFENADYELYDFDPAKWNSRARFDKVMKREAEALYDVGEGWKSDTNNVWFYYENFDSLGTDLPAYQKMNGNGVFNDKKTVWNTVMNIPSTELPPGDYVMRYWCHIRTDRPDGLAILEMEYNDGTPPERLVEFDTKQTTVIVADWCMVEMEFSVPQNMERLNVVVAANDSKALLLIDELLIQKQNDHPLFKRVMKDNISYVVYNNYWLRTAWGE